MKRRQKQNAARHVLKNAREQREARGADEEQLELQRAALKRDMESREYLRLEQTVLTIKQPALVGRCECGAELRVPIPDRRAMQAWSSGCEIQLDCARCHKRWRSKRTLIVPGNAQNLAAAKQQELGSRAVDKKLRRR